MAVGVVMPWPKWTGFDNDGVIVSGGKLYAYEAGTDTPLDTFSDVALTVPNLHPVTLDSAGRATVYLTPATAYKFVMTDALDNLLWTQDYISVAAVSDVVTKIIAGDNLVLTSTGAVIGTGEVTLTSSGSFIDDVSVAGNLGVAGIIESIAPAATNNTKLRLTDRVTAYGRIGAEFTMSASGQLDLVTQTVSGNAVQTSPISITCSSLTLGGNLLFVDATYDIGASGATRPRDLFLSRNAVVGGTLTVSGFGTHAFSAGGTGANHITLANPTSGTGNMARFQVSAGTVSAYLDTLSQAWTTASYLHQSAVALSADSAGGLSIAASHGSGAIRFYSGGSTERWRIETTGGIYYYGGADKGANTINATKLYAQASSSTTGTAAVIASDGEIARSSSSARYKEHISDFSVEPDDLAVFLALVPKWWDYKGQQNGAAGFISEDLDALPIRNAYGTSPLVNYDKDGLPESNRDYALIGLQHLVLQDHDARIAALESQLAALKAQRN